MLVMARTFRTTDYVEMLVALAPELTSPRTPFLTSTRLSALHAVVYFGSDPNPGGLAWAELLARGDSTPLSSLTRHR